MFRRLRKRVGNQRRGTATIEMALVAPVIFLMVFGAIEFARMMMVRQSLTNAAREGCRKACLITTQNSDDADSVIRGTLKGVILNSMNSETLVITMTPSFTEAPALGTEITAVVEVDCADVSWLPPFFTAGAKIRSSCTMTRE